MDQESLQRFKHLLTIEPTAWTEADKGFMRARASYMTEDQAINLADVLNVPEPALVETESDQPPATPPASATRTKALEDMTKTELTAIAEPMGIEVGVFESKASIIEKILAASQPLSDDQPAQ